MADAALNEDDVYFTDLPVGEVLKRTREHYGRSLSDIEKILRIRAEQLEALENNEIEKLPAKVYAIGFVRSYAEYLGLDGEKMVHLFKVQAKDYAEEPQLQMPAPASDSKLPSKWLLLASVLTLLVLSAVYMAATSETREAVDAVPPVPAEIQQATLEKPQVVEEAPEEAEPVVEEPTLSKKPEKGIILNIRENSWVEIKDQEGRKLLSQVLKAGDQYFVPNRPSLRMSIGNAGGVEIEVDGEPLRLLGGQGVVRRNIPLDGGYLKSQFAQKPLDN